MVPVIAPLRAYWPTRPPIHAAAVLLVTLPVALPLDSAPVPSARPMRPPTVYKPDTLPVAEPPVMLPVVRPASPPAAPTAVLVAVTLAALELLEMDAASL